MPVRSRAILSTLVTATVVAVTAGLLAATPAEARSSAGLRVSSKHIAVTSAGNGKVAVTCRGATQCRGRIAFSRDGGAARSRTYRVPAGRTTYVRVAVRSTSRDNPHRLPASAGRDYRSVSGVRLTVAETSPRRRTQTVKGRVVETRVARQQITGTVTGQGPTSGGVRVDLVRRLRGGNTTVVEGRTVAPTGGTFAFDVRLGANNNASDGYLLRVSGRDQDGSRRTWYWRGASGRPAGGGAHVRDASTIRAKKYGDFRADVAFSSISGTTEPGAEVQVASPPPSFGDRIAQRELDLYRCANVFGSTRAAGDGTWTVGFLPATTSTSNRYMIGARSGRTQAWYGATGQRFGSCHDATSYARSRADLITLTSPLTGRALDVSPTGNTVEVRARYSSAYTPTQQGDRWIRLREKVPGVRILDAPVVAEGLASSKGRRTFSNLPPGRYWVEVGRRTGCADWFPSRFADNRTYFKGADRAGERWKSFRTLRSLPGDARRGSERRARTVQPNPATSAAQNRVPRGYKGWMYRGYCKARGAGTINTLTVRGTGRTLTKTTTRNRQGALVKGRIKRTGGRTNKEMMVRLTSSRGTRVVRTGMTDSKGVFYVAGLAPGRWRISVNSDSWRGIGRAFTGRKTITVKAGKGYDVGTLTFRS